jgi:hypothetical protein
MVWSLTASPTAMPDIVPAWMWRDPGEIIEQLLEHSAREAARPVLTLATGEAGLRQPRDRYYRAWRRCHVKQLMRRLR